MLFNSINFLVFFPVTTVLYFMIRPQWRWFFLLLASCFFYLSLVPAYILILFLIISVDYVAGILIERSVGTQRKWYLMTSIVINLGCLLFFKYGNFIAENVHQIAQFFNWQYSLSLLEIVLPVGLSFHTFQAMSYTIDVYRGQQRAERHLGYYALFVLFYPQLVAGPIERAHHLLPQLKKEHQFDAQRVISGLRLMLWGFFKKLVVANKLAFVVRAAYDAPTLPEGRILAIATLYFAIQIYADFSGYVDIARGAARVMGFHLSENFNLPYFAQSVREFWQRWHITLYQWFRDYVYIPLGGNKKGIVRTMINIFIVFALTGLWHGAQWTFVVWGLLHGFFVSIEVMVKKSRQKIHDSLVPGLMGHLLKPLRVISTFLVVCFSWIFFRAESLPKAFEIIIKISLDGGRFFQYDFLYYIFAIHLFLFFSIAVFFIGEIIRHNDVRRLQWERLPVWFTWPMYYALIAWILYFGDFGTAPFIYFQF